MTWGYGVPGMPEAGGAAFWVAAVLSTLLGLAFTIGIIVLIVLGIRWLIRADRDSRLPGPGAPPTSGWSSTSPATPRPDDPLEILRQRYARGEIDDQEYERRRRTLTGA